MLKPLTLVVKTTMFDEVKYEEDGERKIGLQRKLPLEWKYNHFEMGTEAYTFKDDEQD